MSSLAKASADKRAFKRVGRKVKRAIIRLSEFGKDEARDVRKYTRAAHDKSLTKPARNLFAWLANEEHKHEGKIQRLLKALKKRATAGARRRLYRGVSGLSSWKSPFRIGK